MNAIETKLQVSAHHRNRIDGVNLHERDEAGFNRL